MLQFFLAVESRVSDDVRDDDRIQELVRTVRDAFSTTGPHSARFPGHPADRRRSSNFCPGHRGVRRRPGERLGSPHGSDGSGPRISGS
ncbi:hypothetical protein OHA79_25225 [Streptomyces sp. NBC_00841]|uniref:hypothetical protein n=1 Tax=unclassified Streptomyces TaxID=2593676 RepID=UPI002259570F|nr:MULTISPECIES: hypothetical protein [unclassified Streptomyces]MCX4533759.1 hypothetical protein [Streptomyces sp. NBC_01669]WSA00845.1 hypothetical protein OHA79_25225 [Streptomyces sp. NBC_00841]